MDMLSKNFAFNVLTHSYQTKKPGILNIHSTEDVEPLIQSFQQIVLQPLRYFYHNFITVISVFVINLHKHIIGSATGSMSVYIRHIFGKQEEVTEREIYLVKKYGNHITEDPEAVDADAKVFENFSENNEKLLEKISKNYEKVFEKQYTEESDNKEVTAPLNTNSNINNNISNRNRNININISRETDDADDECSFKFFEKKLFNEKDLSHAVTVSPSIDIDDDNVMHLFGKEYNVTEREKYLIKTYGNHIAKYPETAVPDAELDNIKLTSCEDNVDIKSTLSEDEVDYLESDNADNKEVSTSPNNNDSNYKNINSNISNRNRNIDINISRNSADADAESSFNFFEKKIFNACRWREATSSLHAINISDDNVMHIFIKWMYDYCVSKNEMRKVDNDIFSYASNLLVKGRTTRKMFDDYLKIKIEEQRRAREEKLLEREPRHVNKAAFETIRDGKRYALGGQELPNDVPKQTDARWRWSYRMHKYVDISEFEEKKEMDFFNEQKRNEKEADEAWSKKQIEVCKKRLAAWKQLRHSKALDKSSESS